MDKAIFDMQGIGKRVSSLRKKNSMTQMELADRLGISYQAISNWERGLTMPDISKLPDLAQIFSISIDGILGDGTKIIERVIADKKPGKDLTVDKLIEIAPILKPEQVDKLVDSVNNGFTDDQASKLIPLMSFEGEYEYSNEELIDKFYLKDRINFFFVLVSVVSREKLLDLATSKEQNHYRIRAFEDNMISFYTVLSHHSVIKEV